MKFAHLADCHIGGWREENLKNLSILAFEKAIDKAVEENVGFILIAGDLFNTALPNIELIKETARILKKASNKDIDVYYIPGSHDFSMTGKSMLDVFEKAGILKNVMKFKDNKLIFTEDKTGVKLTGFMGKRGGLDKKDYETLDKEHLENEPGFKIFLFHALLTDLKPKGLEKAVSMDSSLLPSNFDYYAGGHPHFVKELTHGKGKLTYTGPLFPNSFDELEELGNGGFYIVDDQLNIKRIEVKLKDRIRIEINADDKTPEEVENEIRKEFEKQDINDKIITLRVLGTLKQGKPGDIKFKEIFSKYPSTFAILKNTNKLTTKEFQEIKIESGNIEEVEDKIIRENLKEINLEEFDVEKLTHSILGNSELEKKDGETNNDFETRLTKELIMACNIKDIW